MKICGRFFASLVLAIGALSGQSRLTNNHRLILLFVDITGSIRDQEFNGTLLKSLATIKALPYGAELEVYPICEDAQLPPRLYRIESYNAPFDTKQEAEFRREMQDARKRWNGREPQSCILRTLQFASSTVGERQRVERQNPRLMDVVLISDMIEDCRSSPFGVGINVSTPQRLAAEVLRLGKFESPLEAGKLNFSGARVHLLLTPRNTNVDRPDVESLRQYWRSVFDKAVSNTSFSWIATSRLSFGLPTQR